MATLKKAPLQNEAIGTYEAAALMGVSFTRPKKMASSGLISIREIVSGSDLTFSVYSARECDQNFLDYEENYASRRKSGDAGGRPRTRVHERQFALERLGDPQRPRIAFEDAIGTAEVADILGVFPTRVPRLAREGKLVGRIMWSERGGKSRLWIFSKVSTESLAAAVRKLEASGEKLGRPRNAASKKTKKRQKA